MEVHQLVYQSQSLIPFTPLDLTELLHHARTYNRGRKVSGMLLYTPDGRFLQVLEGPQAAVRDLYFNRIAVDSRHVNCRVLGEGPALGRSFADWPLAFCAAQAQDLRALLGTVPPDTPALLVPRPRTRPELMALLRAFAGSSRFEPAPRPALELMG